MSFSQRTTNEEFIIKAKNVHGDKYNYSKCKYVNSRTKITIICPEHGEFHTRPDMHIDKRGGRGCPECGHKTVSKEEFKRRAKNIHGDKYDYSKMNYINTKTKITIICPEHGDFLQRPEKHMSGKGCVYCNVSSRYGLQITNEAFVNEAKNIHGDKYNYSKVNVINVKEKITIICPEHGEFLQTPTVHVDFKLGCPSCAKNKFGSNVSSAGDKWLDSLNIPNLEREKVMNIGDRRFKVDGFDKNTNTIYEYFGSFWHGNPNRVDLKDIHPFRKIKYVELYQETLDRIQHFKNNGYNIIYEWGR